MPVTSVTRRSSRSRVRMSPKQKIKGKKVRILKSIFYLWFSFDPNFALLLGLER